MDLAAEQDSPGRFDSPQAGRWAEAKGRAQADQPSAAQLDSALTTLESVNESNPEVKELQEALELLSNVEFHLHGEDWLRNEGALRRRFSRLWALVARKPNPGLAEKLKRDATLSASFTAMRFELAGQFKDVLSRDRSASLSPHFLVCSGLDEIDIAVFRPVTEFPSLINVMFTATKAWQSRENDLTFRQKLATFMSASFPLLISFLDQPISIPEGAYRHISFLLHRALKFGMFPDRGKFICEVVSPLVVRLFTRYVFNPSSFSRHVSEFMRSEHSALPVAWCLKHAEAPRTLNLILTGTMAVGGAILSFFPEEEHLTKYFPLLSIDPPLDYLRAAPCEDRLQLAGFLALTNSKADLVRLLDRLFLPKFRLGQDGTSLLALSVVAAYAQKLNWGRIGTEKDKPKKPNSTFAKMREQEALKDVTIALLGPSGIRLSSHKVHRLVLAASSDYFSRLFASSFADSNSPTVELKDVDPTSFNIMLEFFYGADLASLLPKDLPDPTPLLSDLLQLGTRFFATPFIQSCLELLLRHLKFSGLVDIWEASRPLPNFLPSSASPATSSSTPSPSPLLSSPSSVIAYSSPSSSPPILRRLVRFFTHNVKDWDARVIKQLLSSPTRCEEIKLTLLDLSLRSEYDKEKLPPKA